MLSVSVKVKPLNGIVFFDAPEIAKRVGKAKAKAMGRLGAFTRTRARSSIKPAKIRNRKEMRRASKEGKTLLPIFEPSKPGEPPRSRRPGAPLKKILFGFEPTGGPDKQGNVAIGFGLAFASKTGTPARLEKGGELTNKRGRVIRVAKRPTLVPAFAIEKQKAGPLFADTL